MSNKMDTPIKTKFWYFLKYQTFLKVKLHIPAQDAINTYNSKK